MKDLNSEPNFSVSEIGLLKEYFEFSKKYYSQVNDQLRKGMQEHPLWGAIFSARTHEQQREQNERILEIQRAAIFDGKWDAYTKDLIMQGITYARMDMRYADWYQIFKMYKDHLTPYIIQEHGTDITKAMRIKDGLGKLMDYAMCSIAEAYSREKNSVIDQMNKELERRVEERTAELNEYKLFFETSNDMTCIANTEGYFLELNRQFEQKLGYSSEELTMNTFLYFVHPQDMDATLLEVKKLSNGAKTVNFENRYRKKDGSYLWFEWNTTPDPETGKLYAIARDITEQRQMQDDLKESNSFLASILENIPDMVFVKEAKELRFIKMNNAGLKLLGLESEEIIGKNDHDLFAKKMAEFYIEKDREVLDKGEHLDIPEEKIKTPTGTKWLRTQKIPILDENGQASYLLGISRDITKPKREREKRRKAIVALRTKNAEITDSINYAKHIQEAFLPELDAAMLRLTDAFALHLPKDVLSGDFHWSHYSAQHNCSYVAVGDCTGHGVPGSLMTVLAVQMLERHIIGAQRKLSPQGILYKIDEAMIRFLHQNQSVNLVNDGMEIVLLRIDHAYRKLYFSSAGRSLYHCSNGKMNRYKQQKWGVGGFTEGMNKEFEIGKIRYRLGDRIYAFSDGYSDQFGGKEVKKMLRKRKVEYLAEIQSMPFNEHAGLLKIHFVEWKGKNEQIDDVVAVGLEL